MSSDQAPVNGGDRYNDLQQQIEAQVIENLRHIHALSSPDAEMDLMSRALVLQELGSAAVQLAQAREIIRRLGVPTSQQPSGESDSSVHTPTTAVLASVDELRPTTGGQQPTKSPKARHQPPSQTTITRPEIVIEEPVERSVTPEMVAKIDPASLSEEAAIILACSLNGKKIRVEELKTVARLDKYFRSGNWEAFRHNFPALRKEIVTVLKNSGLDVAWIESDRLRAKKYQLLLAETMPASSSQDEPKPADSVEQITSQPVAEGGQPAVQTEKFQLRKIAGLPMSDNELEQMQKAINYLCIFEERKSLKEILHAIFGRARLHKAEEARIITLLNGYAEAGILRAYGKTYGFRTEAERNAQSEQPSDLTFELQPRLDESDIQIIRYVEEKTENGKTEINVGQLVREFFQTDRLEPDEFEKVKAQLNLLAEKGYLFHAAGSAWYGLGSRRIRLGDADEGPILIPLEQEHLHPQAPNDKEKTEPSTAQPESSIGSAASKLELPELHLTDREKAMLDLILASIKPGKWFKQSDINLSSLGFSSESAQRQAFTKLMEKLVPSGTLLTNGVPRGGKKYQLPESKAASDSLSSPVSSPAKPVSHQKQTPVTKSTSVPVPVQTPEVVSPRQAMRFAGVLKRGIDDMISYNDGQSEKLTVVNKRLSEAFGVTPQVSREWIGELIDKGHYHFESASGVRKIVYGPGNGNGKSQRNGNGDGNDEKSKEVAKAWTQKDIAYAWPTLQELLKLRHVQQGIEIKNLIRALAIPEDEQEDYRRFLRKFCDTGYVWIDTKTNPNTRSNNSKRLQLPLVKIANQKIKEWIKQQPNEIMSELRTLVPDTTE